MNPLYCPACGSKIGDGQHLIVRRLKTVLRDGRIRCKCGHDIRLNDWRQTT